MYLIAGSRLQLHDGKLPNDLVPVSPGGLPLPPEVPQRALPPHLLPLDAGLHQPTFLAAVHSRHHIQGKGPS